MTADDMLRIRARMDDRTFRASQLRTVIASGHATFIGRVVAAPAVPTSVGAYFSVNPVSVLGQETEGGSGSISVNPAVTVLVYVCGKAVPVAGDDLICRFIGNRWVAEKSTRQLGGGVRVPIAGCPCTTTPVTLQMVSRNPGANSGMFQSSSLVYGPTPSEFRSLNLPASIHLSPGSFRDSLSNYPFRYYFACENGAYVLRRLYPETILVSPYKDDVRYRWALSSAGNSCSPLILLTGRAYDGGDPNASVVVTE